MLKSFIELLGACVVGGFGAAIFAATALATLALIAVIVFMVADYVGKIGTKGGQDGN